MRTIDDEIRFHLTKHGWHLGDTEIEISDSVYGVEVHTAYLDGAHMAAASNGKIFISHALARYASLPQRRLVILHELAHIHLNTEGMSNYAKEFACDAWALKEMMRSGEYNDHEHFDAIMVFGEVINEPDTNTHPSSKSRFKRLYNILRRGL